MISQTNVKKLGFIILAIIIVMIVINTFVMTGFTIKEQGLKVGVILPLSGEFAFIGDEIQRGMKLAQDESGKDIKIIFEDDQFTPSISVNAANKLTNINQVDVGVTVLVEEAKPITPIFENSKTPLVVVWDSTKFIKNSEFMFSTGFSTELAGEKIADFSFNKQGLRKIAVVSHNEPWSELISKSFKQRFKELGGEIVLHERHNLEDNDFRGTITKIKNSNADGVYLPLIAPNSVDFLVQTKELNLNKQLLSADGLLQDVIDASGIAAEEIYYTNIFTDNSEGLRKKYLKKYGSESIDITLVSFGYDAFKTVIKAYEENPDDLKQGLFDVIEGKTINRVERIYQVRNGKPVLVEY